MSPTPAEAVAATLTPPDAAESSRSDNNNNNYKCGNSYRTTAAAAAAAAPATTIATASATATAATATATARLSVAQAKNARNKETSNELSEGLPETPQLGTSRLGSDVLWMTPDQMAEAYAKAVNERENGSSSNNTEENVKRGRSFNWQSIVKKLTAFRNGLLNAVGKFLLFILHLDMHGGNTGNNIKFVEGLVDFLAGSIGECYCCCCYCFHCCDSNRVPHTIHTKHVFSICGPTGGAAQVYVSQPLDTVKVKLQTFPEKYKGMLDCFLTTYRRDGVMRGLYAGSIPAVFANVAENSVLFAAYGGCQKFVTYMVGKELANDLTVSENACAGSLAACFSTLTLCPTELIKCKLQALREMKHFVEPSAEVRTPWTLTRYIWRTEGG